MRKYVIPQSMSMEYFLSDHLGSTSITTDSTGAKISEIKYKPWGEVRYSSGTTAIRKNGTLNYILGDHLGSTSIVTNAAGALVSKQLYSPWGETRYSSGLSPTQYQYTGQYSHTADFGLMFYNARWYDPALGRFAQADTVVPGGVQGLDRYAYANNSPLVYVDPSGHCGLDAKGNTLKDSFDCAAKDISSWTISQRKAWFIALLKISGTYESGWFNNILGILDAFEYEGYTQEDGWISWTDAGILESIQNGYRESSRGGGEKGLAGAASEWKDFFNRFYRGDAAHEDLRQLWGEAEQAGTNYGRDLAENKYGYSPDLDEQGFLLIGNIYRGILLNGYSRSIGEWAGDKIAPQVCPPSMISCAEAVRKTSGDVSYFLTDPTSRFGGIAPVYFAAIAALNK